MCPSSPVHQAVPHLVQLLGLDVAPQHLQHKRQAVQALEPQRRAQRGAQPPLRRLVVHFNPGGRGRQVGGIMDQAGAVRQAGFKEDSLAGSLQQHQPEWYSRDQRHSQGAAIARIQCTPGRKPTHLPNPTHCPRPTDLMVASTGADPRRCSCTASRCSRSCRALSHAKRPASPGYCSGSSCTSRRRM